jgi:hypothetical protein
MVQENYGSVTPTQLVELGYRDPARNNQYPPNPLFSQKGELMGLSLRVA